MNTIEALKDARRALAKAEFAMQFHQWHWKSDASNDMKREACADVLAAIAKIDAITARSYPEPLSNFTEGQWWVAELDAMVKNGTDDQKRAVAVVHHLLLSVQQHVGAVQPEPGERTYEMQRALLETPHYRWGPWSSLDANAKQAWADREAAEQQKGA